MSDKISRFGWLDAVLFFSLLVLVLKAFKVVVCVFALKDLAPRFSALALQGDELAIPTEGGFASWVTNASASNPFLSYVEQLVFVVLCLAFLSTTLAISLFLKRERHG